VQKITTVPKKRSDIETPGEKNHPCLEKEKWPGGHRREGLPFASKKRRTPVVKEFEAPRKKVCIIVYKTVDRYTFMCIIRVHKAKALEETV
jgi:hypothetical protein